MRQSRKIGGSGSTGADVRLAWWLGVPLCLFLLLPIVALVVHTAPAELAAAVSHPMLVSAAWLSVRTSLLALAIIVIAGTPLAWWLARARTRRSRSLARLVATALELPIVIPPAVLGVALLHAYGQRGLLGGPLSALGLSVSFSTAAVVIAQIVVAAPFFVQSATAGFRKVDDDLLLVAQTLGVSPVRAIVRVALPLARPALITGAALAWARALGEFGATLLFAGSLPEKTQTMPLAIYAAMEVDIGLARALALVLGALAFAILLGLRLWTGLTADEPAEEAAEEANQ